jgi:Holliday junction resolvase
MKCRRQKPEYNMRSAAERRVECNSAALSSRADARASSGGARHRRVGNACEREVVERHRALGIKAERYPLSGASRFRGSGHDVDIYAFGNEEAPLVAEVKKRKDGGGFTTLEKWLGQYDLLVLRRSHADPMIVLQWRVWAQLLERMRR